MPDKKGRKKERPVEENRYCAAAGRETWKRKKAETIRETKNIKETKYIKKTKNIKETKCIMATKETKKVSVIIPFYNGADYLEQCVEGLRKQTYPEIEMILIDDGSTDGSERLCERLAGQYSGIRVYHTKRLGVSAARNRGIEAAEGEYLTFVDVDDHPMEGMIRYLVDLLEGTGSDVSGCDFVPFTSYPPVITDAEKPGIGECSNSTGQEQLGIGEYSNSPDQDPPETGEPFAGANSYGRETWEILKGREWIDRGILAGDTRCWSKLYKKEALSGIRFPEGMTIGEDMLFLLQLAIGGCSLSRGHYRGYGYFLNEKGAMLQNFKDTYMDQIACWKQALEIIEREYPECRTRVAAQLLVGVMLTVGKLTILPDREREKKLMFRQKCSLVLQEILPDREVLGQLDRGYRIKVRFFHRFPGLYMWLYGSLKRWRSGK